MIITWRHRLARNNCNGEGLLCGADMGFYSRSVVLLFRPCVFFAKEELGSGLAGGWRACRGGKCSNQATRGSGQQGRRAGGAGYVGEYTQLIARPEPRTARCFCLCNAGGKWAWRGSRAHAHMALLRHQASVPTHARLYSPSPPGHLRVSPMPHSPLPCLQTRRLR